MRKVLAGVAAAALFASPTVAATMVTTASSCAGSVACVSHTTTLQAFNSSLGTLTGITLQIDGDKSAQFNAYPADITDINASGTLVLGTDEMMSAIVNGLTYQFEIMGPEIDLTTTWTNLAQFRVYHASGTGVFDLDPSLFSTFTDTSTQCTNFDTGVCASSTSAEFSFVKSISGVYFNYLDNYAATKYTLTYTYTPLGEAVPEPASWAMMLLGFLALGFSIRRNEPERGFSRLP